MDTARRYDTELISGDEVHSDDIFINSIIVGDNTRCVIYKYSLINADGIIAVTLGNADDVGSDIGIIDNTVGRINYRKPVKLADTVGISNEEIISDLFNITDG